MLTFVVRRLLYSIPVLLVASVLVFVFVRSTTDPLQKLRLGNRDTGAIEREEKRLGLDKPLPAQYLRWASGFVRGDWGESDVSRRDVKSEIWRSLKVTVQLILWSVIFSALVAIFIGVYSAVKQYSALDYIFTGVSFVGLSMPAFFFGLMAIQLFAFQLTNAIDPAPQWRPIFFSVGLKSSTDNVPLDYIRHLFLPVITLSVQLVAGWSRYQRSSMLDVMSADYIRTARAKGLPRRKVIVKHGLRNALIPLMTVMAIDIGALFGGLIVTETIFSVPGMGRLFVSSLVQGDVPILLPWLLVTALFIVIFNLLADVLYGTLDPQDPAVVNDEDLTSGRAAATVGSGVLAQEAQDSGEQAAADATIATGEAPARSQWQLFLRRFFKHKLAVGALVVLLVMYVLVIFAPQIAPYDLNPELTAEVLADARMGPTAEHWFGTDELGRDQVTRILYAGRVSLFAGLAVALMSCVIGTAIGAMAGYFGGRVDQFFMRLTDLVLVVPALAVLLIASKKFGSSVPATVVILSGLYWMTVARVVRGVFLSLKEKEFVEAARASGASNWRIIVRHMLPNTIGPIVVNTSLVVGAAILTESTLSFLGFGVQPPTVTWGNMIAQSVPTVGTPRVYLIYFPGLALLLTVLCVNFLGDGLRDALDPQSKQ